jgi:hypothetical protein
MDLGSYELLQEGRIPLPKKTTLVWIGFTSDGAPAMYDSAGLLSVLDRFRRPGQARWVPLLDSTTLTRREGKQESYWPVGVTSSHFTCVILKASLLIAGLQSSPTKADTTTGVRKGALVPKTAHTGAGNAHALAQHGKPAGQTGGEVSAPFKCLQ